MAIPILPLIANFYKALEVGATPDSKTSAVVPLFLPLASVLFKPTTLGPLLSTLVLSAYYLTPLATSEGGGGDGSAYLLGASGIASLASGEIGEAGSTGGPE